MPLYEYQCEKCGKTFEIIQKFSDTPLTVHEGCGGKVEKQLSAPGPLHFKGSGWYVTDYARGGASKSEDKPSDGQSSEGKSSESKASESKASESKASETRKSDSKPAETKSDSKPAPAAKSE
jgi:putative FmdB family regulatory protein